MKAAETVERPGAEPLHPEQRRADIQGLRALAVLAVIAYHADHALAPGGFVGVDIFFVISGYLITGILLRPMEQRRFSLIEFYRRRVRRLFPALFTVMTAALLAGLLLFPPTLLIEQVESQFFAMIFLSNFYFADKTDYFDIQAGLMPLLHTWSLGVEEQFYLFFPPLLYALHRWAKERLWIALGTLALLSFAFSQASLAADAEAAFYSPAARAFELLIGALLVGVERHVTPSQRLREILAGAGVLGIIAALFLIERDHPFPGWRALVPCFSTAALILSRGALANRLFSAPPLARIGDMSYSLYLWHWPMLVFARFVFPASAAAITIAIIFSFAAAAFSWRYIEKPFLEGKVQRIFPLAAAATVASIAFCLPIYLAGGLPQRFPPEARVFLQATEDFNKDRYKCHMRSDRPVAYETACVYGDRSAAPSFAVWGDSHGAELAKVLGERLASQGASLRSLTMSGCPATLSRGPVCRDHNIAMLAAIENDPAMRVVVLASNLHGSDKFARESVEGVKATALELQKAGKQVVLVYPIPTHDFDPPSLLAIAARSGADVAKVGMARARHEDKSGWIVADFERFTKTHGLIGVDPADFLCDEETCRVYRSDSGVLYYNQGHLSLTGAGLLADRILAAMTGP